jgi:hypothetical protein
VTWGVDFNTQFRKRRSLLFVSRKIKFQAPSQHSRKCVIRNSKPAERARLPFRGLFCSQRCFQLSSPLCLLPRVVKQDVKKCRGIVRVSNSMELVSSFSSLPLMSKLGKVGKAGMFPPIDMNLFNNYWFSMRHTLGVDWTSNCVTFLIHELNRLINAAMSQPKGSC